jgi:hypothetical protein
LLGGADKAVSARAIQPSQQKTFVNRRYIQIKNVIYGLKVGFCADIGDTADGQKAPVDAGAFNFFRSRLDRYLAMPGAYFWPFDFLAMHWS